MRMVVTRPEHDPTTRYISQWAVEILSEARKKNIEVVDLVRERANRREFEGRARKLRPEFVFLNGHGGGDRVCGHDNEPLVVAGENEDVLNGAVTYAVSCDSAKILGKLIGNDAGSSYIGYQDEFVFSYDPSCVTKPLGDARARPFMEFSNTVARVLLKGGDCATAMRRAKEVAMRHVRTTLSSASDVGSLQRAKNLLWDMRLLTCHGDQARSL